MAGDGGRCVCSGAGRTDSCCSRCQTMSCRSISKGVGAHTASTRRTKRKYGRCGNASAVTLLCFQKMTGQVTRRQDDGGAQALKEIFRFKLALTGRCSQCRRWEGRQVPCLPTMAHTPAEMHLRELFVQSQQQLLLPRPGRAACVRLLARP